MKLVKDAAVAEWLLNSWNGLLDWDEHNIWKLAKHDVSQEAVESLFDGDVVYIGQIIEPEGVSFGEKRHLILGVVHDGRYFSIVCTPKEDTNKLRPISCRRMRKNEEIEYDNTKRIRLR